VALARPRPQDAVAALLAGVDVHVLPSLQEIPGLSTLEAAAVGCEVVVTPGGSAQDYLGGLGHQAWSTRARDIAAAIEHASAHPQQPALRARVERFDWREAGPALVTAYNVALARPPTSP
jgi:glycosyltransferase involved in cell wall biosynthesis